MRALLPVLVLLAFCLPSAVAHDAYPGCGASRLDSQDVVWTSLHANVWAGGDCVGVTVSWDVARCLYIWEPWHVFGVHPIVLEGDGCPNGVLVELP